MPKQKRKRSAVAVEVDLDEVDLDALLISLRAVARQPLTKRQKLSATATEADLSTNTALVVMGDDAEGYVPPDTTPKNGPFVALTEVLGELFGVKRRSKELSLGLHEMQHKLLKRVFASDGPVGKLCPHAPALFHRLEALAFRIHVLTTALLEGWDADIQRRPSTVGNVVNYEVTDKDNAEFCDWFPFCFAYRAIGLPNGRHVPALVNEFLSDVFAPGRRGAEREFKFDNMHPMLKAEANALLKTKCKASKRQGSRIGENKRSESARVAKGKARRLAHNKAKPSVGPLGWCEFASIREDLGRYIAAVDRGEFNVDASAIKAKFPHTPFEDLLTQFKFHAELDAIYQEAVCVFLEFVDGPTPLFGMTTDFDALCGVFALSVTNSNQLGNIEGILTHSAWLIRLVHRFLSLHTTELSDMNYVDVDKVDDCCVFAKRRSSTVDGDVLFRSLSGQIESLIESLIVKEIFTFFKIRWSAFAFFSGDSSPSPTLPAYLVPPPKMTSTARRVWLQEKIGVSKNDPNAVKDALKCRFDELSRHGASDDDDDGEATRLAIAMRVTGANYARCVDAIMLETSVLGGDETVRVHGDRLQSHGLGELVDCEMPGEARGVCGFLDARIFYCRAIDSNTQRLFQLHQRVPFLSNAARKPIPVLIAAVDELSSVVAAALDFYDDVVEQSMRVSKLFDSFRAEIEAEIARLRLLPPTALTDAQANEAETDADEVKEIALSKALNAEAHGASAFLRIVRARLVSTRDGSMQWQAAVECARALPDKRPRDTVDLASSDGRSRLAALLCQWHAALRDYRAMLDEAAARGLSHFFDFLIDDVAETLRHKSSLTHRMVGGESVATNFATTKVTKAELDVVVRMRIDSLVSTRHSLVDRLMCAIMGAMHKALWWSNAYASHVSDAALAKLPRVALGVSGACKLLTVADAFGRVAVSDDPDERDRFVRGDAEGPFSRCVFFVLDGGAARQDVRWPPLERLHAIARDGDDGWQCVVHVAEVARELLSHHDQLRMTTTHTVLPDDHPCNVRLCDPASEGGGVGDTGFFVRGHGESREETLRRLTIKFANVADADPRSLADVAADLPSRPDTFLTELQSEAHFKAFLEWNPMGCALSRNGFFGLTNISFLPEEDRGLLSCLKEPTPSIQCSQFRGFYFRGHRITICVTPLDDPLLDMAMAPAFAVPQNDASVTPPS
jgi:hypothetical protein